MSNHYRVAVVILLPAAGRTCWTPAGRPGLKRPEARKAAAIRRALAASANQSVHKRPGGKGSFPGSEGGMPSG